MIKDVIFVDLENTQTKQNLMRAFAGESQARNRYLFAAKQAETEQLQVLQHLFQYTANQEFAHAKVYYDFLKPFSPGNINIEAGYPVDIYDTTLELIRAAERNEFNEYEHSYSTFSRIAASEGFPHIAYVFKSISEIERVHGERFKLFGDWLGSNQLFKADQEIEWLCLHCGHVHKAVGAPTQCPVCNHPQGFFVRLDYSPFQPTPVIQ